MGRIEFWIVEYEGRRFRWQGFPLVPGLTFLHDYGRDGIDAKDTSLERFHVYWSMRTGESPLDMLNRLDVN